MTLHKDPMWEYGIQQCVNWLHEWCLDCDSCGNHVHIPPTKDDPRMSSRCNRWKLDVNGKDFCPDCVNK